jgi:hypothetical protein
MSHRNRLFPVLIPVFLLLAAAPGKIASAQTAPPLGTARGFAVLGASTVTSTGPTLVTGHLGVSPGTAITGFPPGIVTGNMHVGDAVAAQARADAQSAYNLLASQACGTNLSGSELGGRTLTSGVYCFNSSAQLTGTLTLDAQGNPNAVFIFKIGSTLTTASNASVAVINGGSPCSVFWQVGSSATLGTGTQLAGNILALASITMTTGASASGGSYALTGAVTMDSNQAGTTACMSGPQTGTIRVCKVAGAGVNVGTNFNFTVGGTAVTVAAGTSPLGTCSAPIVVPAQPTLVTETIPPGTTLSGVSTLPGAGLLISSNLAAGTATVAVNPGGQTTVTFIDTRPPVIPTTGFLQICKIGGAGVTAGTNFVFNAAGTVITVPAGTAPGGSCSQPIEKPAGQALITETVPAGTSVTNVATLPSAGLLVSSNLALGQATVTINAGAQTIVTFTNAVNPTTGFVQVCKVAGSGIPQGTNFAFNVAGTPVIVPAGPAPGGSCSSQIQLPAGPASVTETLPANTLLASIATLPSAGLLVSSNLSAGTATVTVTAGGLTIVTFTNTVVPITTGFLQICKVAGSGVAVGTNFTFNVAGTPVNVAAGAAPGGSCSAPMVSPAGPVTIIETLPSGTVLTGVTALPAGLLLSSNLAAGTATVTVVAGGQTIVTFLNTVPPVIPTTGFLQVCKVAGAGVAIGTSFNFNVAGTAVIVPAGAAPGGSCSVPVQVQAGQRVITETLPAGTTLASVTTLPTGLLVSSNLAAGTATVTVNAGGQTIVTFVDTIIPVIPTTGFLQICKVAGAGVAVGSPFQFTVAGNPVIIPAGSAPGGSCSPALVLPVGSAVITETLPSGTVLTGISTLPSGLLVSSNLAAGTATVTITPGGQTIVTFINSIPPVIPTTGFLQICKVAGSGVAVGTNFTFNVAGAMVVVPAGPAPGGSCSTPRVIPAGPVSIAETLTAGAVLTAVSTLPDGLLLNSNLAAGTATVTVVAGGQTIVTFLNTVLPVIPTTGFLQVCKVAGAGVAVGTPFNFNVAGTIVTVPAGAAPGGSCGVPVQVQAGQRVITETLPAGTTLTSVTTLPAGLLVSSNLAAGTATVTVNAGGQTIVTFLDTILPVIPTTGFLQICKIAGAGVAVGTNFTFNVAGNPVIVPAGPAPGGNCSAPLVVPVGATAISELPFAGTVLTGVSTLPGGLLVSSNLAAGTATVTVNAGSQTIVTFLNSMIPAVPMGFLQICKIGGTGVTPGTNFTFNVAGSIVMVPAGSCSQGLQLPAGQAVVTEVAQTGSTLVGITASPSARLVASSLTDRSATVAIVPGDASTQSILTFTNQVELGLLKVCKIAGTGVTPGTRFTIAVNGSNVVVPAGSCVMVATYPTGTSVTLAETPPIGTTVSAISVLPADRLGSVNLAGRTITVTVGTGVTEVYFTNTAVVGLGLLKVCKIAGQGVTPGTYFNFALAGTNFRVPAGYCVMRGTLPIGTVVTITEFLSPGTVATAIHVLPANRQGLVDLPGRAVTATIGEGVTEVQFTNAVRP